MQPIIDPPDAFDPVARIVVIASVNPPSMTSGQFTAQVVNVTIAGAAIGDVVRCGPGITMSGIIWSAYVSAQDTVTIAFFNPTAATLDIAASNWRIVVEKYKVN